ncbi:2-dehydropantoate 2-reductase [Alteromonas lipolytica]|uniref:2-dehydropantoate 2-reductase n=1 Tax=Alteromonas lipolytica TaxID=1856405 RepID=A0A1E8FIL3_9ALTE|nr:2-dehydropantoate 2-reductase [Alteromonas lipolytica]OFI35759.1 hypothetical protein BFC17_10760 [Alteromonas lipolytica]GGF80521.1 2-dehydropantoate 2-reductase [Alteromonas lipolytica]
MTEYRHLIVGSGLIGCFLGSLIGQRAQVGFVGREPWLTRLTQGVTLTDYAGHEQAYQAAENQCSTVIPNLITRTVVWLTVKNTALESTLKALQSKLGEHCVVICCQNGLGAPDMARRYLPAVTLLQAIVGCNVVWDATRCSLHKATQGGMYIEQPHHFEPTLNQALQNIAHPLLTVSLRHDIQAIAWAKLQLNLANSINTIVNQPVKTMLLDKACREVIALLMDELLAVAAARGIRLPRLTRLPARWLPVLLRLPTWLFRRLASAMLHIDDNARSSMWWDIAQGKQTEIDYLNGALNHYAGQVRLSCPLNNKVTALVKALEAAKSDESRGILDGKTLKYRLHLK